MRNYLSPTPHKENALNNSRVIDITGISAIGKSTWLKERHSNKKVVILGLVKNDSYFKNIQILVLQQLELLFFCFFNKTLSYSNIYWLFKSSMTLNENFKIKFNVFRNCLLKFMNQSHATQLSSKDTKKIIYIDEGISHIPFLLQNQIKNTHIIDEFFLRFSWVLSKLDIVCLESSCIDTFSRLKERGHKRLSNATDSEIHQFVDMNKNTLLKIKNHSSSFLTFKLIDINA